MSKARSKDRFDRFYDRFEPIYDRLIEIGAAWTGLFILVSIPVGVCFGTNGFWLTFAVSMLPIYIAAVVLFVACIVMCIGGLLGKEWLR